METTILVVAVFCFIAVSAYTIPDPEIQLLSPRGIRVSIPDETGIQLFTFNGNVNRNIDVDVSGSVSGEVFRSTSGRWVFEDPRTTLLGRDALHYWLYVQVDGNPYKKTGSWSIPSRVKPSCTPSVTTTTQQGSICQNQLIFEDNFDQLNSSIWSREIFIPSPPNYEFCVYHQHPESVRIQDGILHVIPSLLEDSYGEGATLRPGARLVLAECTSPVPSDCNRTVIAYKMLPPVISARLTTAKHFSFRYGRIEIRAKFPEGDWLYPELWLQPKNPSQTSGFRNVRVRLGMARGNRVLRGGITDYGANLLEFGVRNSGDNYQDLEVHKLRESGDPWTSGYHVYSTIWNPDGFVFHVDGAEVGRLNPGPDGWFGNSSNNKMTPFNEQFYITLGVGVGGMRDFPDNTRSGDGQGYDKPWTNVTAKAMLRFWRAKDQWLPSWSGSNRENSQLQIDYVRVWSL